MSQVRSANTTLRLAAEALASKAADLHVGLPQLRRAGINDYRGRRDRFSTGQGTRREAAPASSIVRAGVRIRAAGRSFGVGIAELDGRSPNTSDHQRQR